MDRDGLPATIRPSVIRDQSMAGYGIRLFRGLKGPKENTLKSTLRKDKKKSSGHNTSVYHIPGRMAGREMEFANCTSFKCF